MKLSDGRFFTLFRNWDVLKGPNPKWGDKIVAVVILKQGAVQTEESIQSVEVNYNFGANVTIL